jgi:hypothetical protein
MFTCLADGYDQRYSRETQLFIDLCKIRHSNISSRITVVFSSTENYFDETFLNNSKECLHAWLMDMIKDIHAKHEYLLINAKLNI